MTLAPLSGRFDAAVGLEPSEMPSFAFVLAKYTYEIQNDSAVLVAPEPLNYDIYNDPDLEPRFPPGSDYWLTKQATDVMVRGCAFAPEGRQVQVMGVAAKIGEVVKRIAVSGNRRVSWNERGNPVFSAPEPFEFMPLLYQHAYGGLDARVPIPPEMMDQYMALLEAGQQYDHPGLYPRNPVGKGYLAMPGPVEGLELPNLEDPDDLLTPERLVTPSPEYWYRQPLPWCFEWSVGLTFPRYMYLDIDAWYPAPDSSELPEVRRGYMPEHVRKLLAKYPELRAQYFQEASLGMVIRSPLAGQPVEIYGMHPEERTLRFVVPPPPQMEIVIEGTRETLEPKLTNFVISPTDKRFSLTYLGMTRALPRVFIPGVHKDIPLAAYVDRELIKYESPVPIRERLQAATAAN